jgi:adenylate cyclase
VEVQSRVKMHLELKTSREILEEQNRKLGEVSRKLSKYLSPQIYESIFSGKKDVKLETQRKKLSVFFSDIQAFTELTDSMEPETLTYVLNDYLNEMSQIALFHGGTVDKFIGDAILVFFGDPETKGVKEDALACLLMSIEMRERIKYLRKKWDSDGIFRPLHIRMGISTGYCTVGNFGSENRLEYTIIGGQVNLANRLQSCAEPDQILISHETYSHVKDEIHCEKKEIIKVKGLAYPVQAYQVIDFKESYPKAESKLKEETKKFLVSLDFKKLSEADKRRLVDALQTTISEIKASS